jgi:molecular chaperone HscC
MIIGIDLGTTNSLVAVFKDGAPVLIPNRLGEFLTPSVVSLESDGVVLTGRAARERLASHPSATAAAFKRHMGTDKKIALEGRSFRAEELSAMVLKALRQDAEAWLGEPVHEAIITVPAYFNDTQRKATRIAGELAGLKVERLLNEPTAAALAYGLNHMPDESKFIVVDLGGGTFDVSILQLFCGVMEVRASAGDNWLGGEDFNTVLASLFRSALLAQGTAEAELPTHSALLLEAERARRALTRESQVQARFNVGERQLELAISRDQFDQACSSLLDRLRTPIERAIRDARLSLGEIHEIVLAGGATRMPVVRQTIARLFGRFPQSRLDPETVVALGAAVQAGLKMRDAALDEIVMTDVAPYSLGVETSVRVDENNSVSGVFSPVIERNTVVPVSRAEQFYAVNPDQVKVLLRIFQGEARHCKENIYLGELEVPVPRASARTDGQPVPIDVRFTYDVSGLLEVEARVAETGVHESLVIERSPGSMTPEQIEALRERLHKLKEHPRDQGVNRAVLARAERVFSQSLRDVRQAVSSGIARFETALRLQDEDQIRTTRKELAALLDEVDRDPFAS